MTMSISVVDLRALGARVRAEAEVAGEMPVLTGSPYWDIPHEVRDALIEDLHSGAYEARARALIADDPPEEGPRAARLDRR